MDIHLIVIQKLVHGYNIGTLLCSDICYLQGYCYAAIFARETDRRRQSAHAREIERARARERERVCVCACARARVPS
jgi:hypothetical protein